MNTEVAPHRAERQVKAIWSIQTDNPFQYSHCIPAFKQSEANTLVQVIATAVTHTVLSKTLKPLEGLSSNMGKRQTLFCRITFNVRFCTPQQRHFSSASVTALQSCHNSLQRCISQQHKHGSALAQEVHFFETFKWFKWSLIYLCSGNLDDFRALKASHLATLASLL